MVDPRYLGFAFSRKSLQHQAQRLAKISGHDGRARQLRYAAHDRAAAVHLNIRAHQSKLWHMHIAVFENRFGEYACALRQRQHRHEMRLHVSGKGGKGRGGKGKWPQWHIGADLDTIRPFLARNASYPQTCQYSKHISGICTIPFPTTTSTDEGGGI